MDQKDIDERLKRQQHYLKCAEEQLVSLVPRAVETGDYDAIQQIMHHIENHQNDIRHTMRIDKVMEKRIEALKAQLEALLPEAHKTGDYSGMDTILWEIKNARDTIRSTELQRDKKIKVLAKYGSGSLTSYQIGGLIEEWHQTQGSYEDMRFLTLLHEKLSDLLKKPLPVGVTANSSVDVDK